MQEISAQVRPELLAEVHSLAVVEDKQLQEVLEEALTEWVARRREAAPEVIDHTGTSDARRRKLYEELANWANLSRL